MAFAVPAALAAALWLPAGARSDGSAPAPWATVATTGAGGQAAGGAGDAGAQGAAPADAGMPASCLPTPGGTPGVDDSSITIGFGYPNLAGAIGNSAVGLGSPDDYKR